MDTPTRELVEHLKVDRTNLYREETLTDLKVATLKQLIPIHVDGSRDLGRKVQFLGETQIMTQMGPLPVQTQIEAATLEEAMDRFPEAIRLAVDEMLNEAREMQRRELSRIVVPGAETASKILR